MWGLFLLADGVRTAKKEKYLSINKRKITPEMLQLRESIFFKCSIERNYLATVTVIAIALSHTMYKTITGVLNVLLGK
jgi:hypothetical protein